MRKMKIEEIKQAVTGTYIRKELIADEYYDAVSTDSREVGVHSLFIPLIGQRFDAHDFIMQVYENGANCVITSKAEAIPEHKGAILVENTEKALSDLARFIRREFKGPVIGITGSVGKTSCKQIMGDVLSRKYKVHKTEGNYNNNIGLPLTILKVPDDAEIMILEMGMNHFDEINHLASICEPDYGVITNIGVAHIENLGSKEGILQAKAEMLQHIPLSGCVLLNGDDEYLLSLTKTLQLDYYLFGFEKGLPFRIETYENLAIHGSRAVISTPADTYHIRLNAIGTHMLYHVLSAIILGEKMGVRKKDIEQGVCEYMGFKMRMEKIVLNDGTILINDTYNASVDSMRVALELIKKAEVEGRKIAILGDMFEMGDYARSGHEQVGEMAYGAGLDLLIGVGRDAKYIVDNAVAKGLDSSKGIYFEKQESLMEEIASLIQPRDTILVKASRGMALEHTIEKIKEVKSE